MGRKGTRLSDYSIGATVLVVAIALPFFVFTRAEHLHRVAATSRAATTPPVQAVITTPDPSTSASPVPTALTPPSPASSARRIAARKPPAHPTAAPSGPTSPTSTPTPTTTATPSPSPIPDSAPVARLVLSPTAGPVPLTVTADASGSSDVDQTPIAQFAFDFGDGTAVTAQSGATCTHTYMSPGTYTVSVAVIDTARFSTTVSASVTVS